MLEISKEAFMVKYRIPEELQNGIPWETLESIYDDYKSQIEFLKQQAVVVAGILQLNNKIHTVRSRVKEPEHLIAKLLRKLPDRREKKEEDFQYTLDNYMSDITDLVGVRAIHIFKEDWKEIHDHILSKWVPTELKANLRNGDNRELYEDNGLEIEIRPSGYRSVHYLVSVATTKVPITVEIQVRTIFEEGYGEIDHLISYPHNDVPKVVNDNLLALNRIAGTADEIASFILSLKNHLVDVEAQSAMIKEQLLEKEEELENLKGNIEKMEIDQTKKDTLIASLKKLNYSGEIELAKTPQFSWVSSTVLGSNYSYNHLVNSSNFIPEGYSDGGVLPLTTSPLIKPKI